MMNEFKRMVARVTVEIPLNRTFIDGGNGRKLPETPAKLLVNLSAPQATADPLTPAKLLVDLSAAMEAAAGARAEMRFEDAEEDAPPRRR